MMTTAAIREALEAARELAKLANELTGCRGDDEYVWGVEAKIDAALSALDQPSGVRVGVKPLEWQKHNVDGTIWDAPSIGGGYVVRFDGKEWLTIKNIAILARSATSDAAKAVARADHDARILSALDLSALVADEVAGVEPAGWRWKTPVEDDYWVWSYNTVIDNPDDPRCEALYSASTLTDLAARAEKAEQMHKQAFDIGIQHQEHAKALEAELSALRARLEEAGKVTRECADLLTDLDLGRSIHNGRFPENKIDGPLWAQIGRVTSDARRFLEEAK